MKLRPVLLLLATFIIGVFLGMLVSAQIRHSKMRTVRMYGSERYLTEVINRVADPTPEQLELLDPIVRKYAKEGRSIQRDFRKEFESHNKHYWDEIKSVLTPEQVKQIEENLERRRGEMRKGRPDRGRRGQRGDGQSNQRSRKGYDR